MIIGKRIGCGTRITVGGTRPLLKVMWWALSSGGAGGGGIRCDGKLWNGGRNLNKLIGGRCINWSGGRLNEFGWICFGPLFIWLWIFARNSDGKLLFMILSLVELVPFELWFALLLSANRADARRLRKLLLWWNILRESNFEDGKTFIRGFFERSMAALSHDKLTELDVIVDDDEGWDWLTMILVIVVGFSTIVVVGVGVREWSGDGDLERQFLSHKSGVIRLSTTKSGEINLMIDDRGRL